MLMTPTFLIQMIHVRSGLLLRAIALSFLLNLPALIEFARTGGLSPWIFSDWDEPIYLPHALRAGAISFADWFEIENGAPRAFVLMGSRAPQIVQDLIVGKIALLLHLTSIELGVALDLLLVPIAFLVFVKVFRLLAASDQIAEVGCVVFLAFPLLFDIGQYLNIPLPWFQNIITGSKGSYPCVPILRGMYTQLSYPIVGLSLGAMFLYLTRSPERHLMLVLSGLFSGMLIYFYFFAWPAITALLFIFLLILLISSRIQSLKTQTRISGFAPVIYLAANMFVALPGVWLLLSHGMLAPSDSNPVIRFDTWYFPPEVFVLLVILLLIFLRSVRDRKQGLDLALLCSCLLAELILLNSQTATQRILAPYHFAAFYLDPLFSGVLAIAILNRFSSTVLKQLGFGSFLFLVILNCGLKSSRAWTNTAKSSETIELLQTIQEKVPKLATIATIPYLHPFEPNNQKLEVLLLPHWITAISSRRTMPVTDGLLLSPFEKELLTAWLFTGKRLLIGSCPDSEQSNKHDTITRFTDVEFLHRTERCLQFRAIPPFQIPCDTIRNREFPNIVLWDKSHGLSKPSWYSSTMTSLWKSSEVTFELLAIKDKELLLQNCRAMLAK